MMIAAITMRAAHDTSLAIRVGRWVRACWVVAVVAWWAVVAAVVVACAWLARVSALVAWWVVCRWAVWLT